jgi:Cu(I)/Ag(I) efflux system membrane fusion protein
MSTRARNLVLLGVAGAFLAGTWFGRSHPQQPVVSGARKILYYHDPMHPAYRSDKPGVAPDCGMQLEPVYADGAPSAPENKEFFYPGTVQLSLEKQQQIGVKIAEVETAATTLPIRVLGRVVADEMRVFRVVAPTDGLIQELKQVTTGSLVKKGETLAVFSNVEFLAAERAFLFALISADKYQTSGQETTAQIEQSKVNVQQTRLTLRKLGMSEPQIEEIAKTRQATENIRVTAPATGFVVVRNIADGLKFDRGMEFFRIADLGHVWVVADVFENDARFLHSLAGASVRYQDKLIAARLSGTLPQFDPVSRVMRVRLEVDNANFTLRPDMFVDVDFQVTVPAAITVPVEAVLDSGLHKTVFVDRGNGFFEPRAIQTGARLGNRLVAKGGLMPGERVVVSGTFLIDSESRLKLSSEKVARSGSANAPRQETDPVCGMGIDLSRADTKKLEYDGQIRYFCSNNCKSRFQADHDRTKGPA